MFWGTDHFPEQVHVRIIMVRSIGTVVAIAAPWLTHAHLKVLISVIELDRIHCIFCWKRLALNIWTSFTGIHKWGMPFYADAWPGASNCQVISLSLLFGDARTKAQLRSYNRTVKLPASLTWHIWIKKRCGLEATQCILLIPGKISELIFKWENTFNLF
jgi:hypothetical protein